MMELNIFAAGQNRLWSHIEQSNTSFSKENTATELIEARSLKIHRGDSVIECDDDVTRLQFRAVAENAERHVRSGRCCHGVSA